MDSSLNNYIRTLKVARAYFKDNSGLVDKYSTASIYKKIKAAEPKHLGNEFKIDDMQVDNSKLNEMMCAGAYLCFKKVGKEKVPTLHIFSWTNPNQFDFLNEYMQHLSLSKLIRYVEHPLLRTAKDMAIFLLFAILCAIIPCSSLLTAGLFVCSIFAATFSLIFAIGSVVQKFGTTYSFRDVDSYSMITIIDQVLDNLKSKIHDLKAPQEEIKKIKQNRKKIANKHTTWHDLSRKLGYKDKNVDKIDEH